MGAIAESGPVHQHDQGSGQERVAEADSIGIEGPASGYVDKGPLVSNTAVAAHRDTPRDARGNREHKRESV